MQLALDVRNNGLLFVRPFSSAPLFASIAKTNNGAI
jgi:hypothetical protein